jgi:hypothetical protein
MFVKGLLLTNHTNQTSALTYPSDGEGLTYVSCDSLVRHICFSNTSVTSVLGRHHCCACTPPWRHFSKKTSPILPLSQIAKLFFVGCPWPFQSKLVQKFGGVSNGVVWWLKTETTKMKWDFCSVNCLVWWSICRIREVGARSGDLRGYQVINQVQTWLSPSRILAPVTVPWLSR